MCNILPLCTICYKNKQNLWLHLLRNRAIINAMQLYMIRIFLVFSHVLRKRSGKFAERKGEHYENWSNRTQLYPRCRFCDELSEGPGCYLFLLVKSPARFLLNGKKLRLEKNTILFFTPHTACRYAAENGTYTDDWFYCNMTPEEELTLRNEGMPFDTPMQTQNAAELSELIRKNGIPNTIPWN